MNKKILMVVLVFFLLVFSAFGQQKVEDFNGFNWVTWSEGQKIGYVLGFMSAYTTVLEMSIYNMNGEPSEKQIKQLNNRFHIPMTVGQIIKKMNKVYSNYDNRQYPVYDVFLIVVGKDYWNRSNKNNEGGQN